MILLKLLVPGGDKIKCSRQDWIVQYKNGTIRQIICGQYGIVQFE